MSMATVNNTKKSRTVFIWDNSSLENCYKNNTNPYDMSAHWSETDNGLEAEVGVVSSYTEKEILDTVKTQLEEDGGYLNMRIPEFNPQGITYYQNSSLAWSWIIDRGCYFYKDGTLYKDNMRVEQNDSFSYNFVQMAEIVEEFHTDTKIKFPVGGAIKTCNSIIYVCSPHTAHKEGDFAIFMGWCIYQVPVASDDKKLRRDPEANGAKVYSIERPSHNCF
jgi:hypothetical protein